MNFVIDRKKWGRGFREGGKRNLLLDAEGMQCCIGQVCTSLGKRDSELFRIGSVMTLNDKSNLLNLIDDGKAASWVRNCYWINDDALLSDQRRESQLKEEFASAGHTLEFKD